MTQLRDMYKRKEQAQEAYEQAEPGFGMRFARRLINNLSLKLSSVSAAFSSRDPAVAASAAMDSLEVQSCDVFFRKLPSNEVVESQGTSLYKILSFDGLSLSYGLTMQALSKVVSPVRAELKVGHVPDNGLLRLEVDLAIDKVTEIQLKRSQLVGVKALNASLKDKWDRLRGMLVEPQVEAQLMAAVDKSQERYFNLFRQQCLSNIDKNEAKVVQALDQTGLNYRPLSSAEEKELETLEIVLPFQLLATERCRAEDFITELVKKATPQAKAGWFSRTFFGKQEEESSLDKLSAEELLKELHSAADVEVVEPPQKMNIMLQGGQALLDVEDDTRGGSSLQLLKLDLNTTSLAVNVASATDHRGQSSADFGLFLNLGSVTVSHQQKPFLKPKVGVDNVQALDLRLENKLESTQNLMVLSLTFAPMEIFMIPGLVASILGFLPGVAEVEKAANIKDHKKQQLELILEDSEADTGPTRAERLRSVLDANAERAKELALEVYNRIPDKISIDIRLFAPTVHVPVASVGKAVITLGQLVVATPEPCLFDRLSFNIDLNHTQVCTVSKQGESFDVVEPLPINITFKYIEEKTNLLVAVAVKVGHLSLSASPEAVNLLMGLPQAMVSMVTMPEGSEAKPSPPQPVHEKVPLLLEKIDAAGRKSIAADVLGEDFAALQRAKELQKKSMRTTVAVEFEDATFALSDSIMPLLRLRLESMPPGLQLSVESGNVSLTLQEASLGIEVLNPRHGDWEPFLERFDFGASLSVAESVRLSVHALGPLLVNLVPTPTRQILELLPLLLKSLRPPALDGSDQPLEDAITSGPKIRVVSLWGGHLEVICTCRDGKPSTVKVAPTGSQWLALDEHTSVLALKHFRVRVPGSDTMSDPLWFEQNAAVAVPDCAGEVVAQLLTPQPDHRLLLLAPALRIHNATDVPLAIRFHEDSRATVVPQLEAATCDAALLGVSPELAVTSHGEKLSSPDSEFVCLPPNSICAVPPAATKAELGATILSLRPLTHSDFSPPSLVGRKPVEGVPCKGGKSESAMHFMVVPETDAGVAGSSGKVKHLCIRPTVSLMNALPIGRLGLDLGPASLELPALQRKNFYGLSVEQLRGGLQLGCRLTPEAPWSAKVALEGSDVVERDSSVQGDEAKVLEVREKSAGAPAAVELECLGYGRIRFSCPYWLLDRSGLKEQGLGKLEVHVGGAKLPSQDGVTLLHADCFENSCELVLRSERGSLPKHSMKLPPNFETFIWRTPSGCLALNLNIGRVKSTSVHGATSMEFTLMPRLVLTNTSDEELELETPERRNLKLLARESRVLHWDVPAKTEGIDILATTFRFRPGGGDFSGAVLCSDGSAGSTPFVLRRNGAVEVWSVDVAPLYGKMGVSIRAGSDFVARNKAEGEVRMQLQAVADDGKEEDVIQVKPGGEPVPIGWCRPFAGKRCRAVKVTVGAESINIPDLQRSAVWPLQPVKMPGGKARKGLVLRVARSGTTTELALEETAERDPATGSQAFQASLELNVKLGRAGISLIDEGPPKPRELFFFSLDMLRLEYLQDAARDAEKITMSISEVQAICQLPGRSDGKDKVNMLDLNRLQHLPNALLQNQELPAVVLANHSAGGKSFLQFHMIRQATSSRDLCVSSSQLDVDKLDFTLDEMWLTPLKQWLSDLGGGGLDVFGSTAEDLLSTAGKPITDGYVAPDVPAVVQAEQVKIGGLDTTVWCSLRLKYLDFLPVYVRAALKVLSFSSFFTLDGVSLVLPARQLEPHRGSLQDYATTIGSQYAYSVLDHIASLLGKSSLLNLPKAPLKLGGAAVALVGDNLKGVTDGAVSMLRNLTLDDEYIARKNRAPKGPIQGAGQGFSAAGKSLWEGVEGMLDVVNKPMEGAKKDGLWGFATGLTKGAMGTIVKPVAAIGTAIGEVGSGLASTTNQLNENEAIQRRRATRRLRLPRLLFGELGEVRPYMNIDALLLQRYGESLSGVCEVVSLEPGGDGKAKSVLLLFSDKLAVASASAEAPEAPSRLERGFPPLKSNKQGAPLRGLHFSELREVSQEGTALNLHTIQGQKYPLELKQAWLPEGAVQALVEGLSAGARHKRLEAHRTWADLRSILRGEAHAARKRDMRMVAETGLKMHPSEAVGPWSIDVTEHTDAEGWVYGMAWSQPEWNKKPLMMDVLRRRRWTRPYS
ncbi:unnamed protein product [Effrenium voratum]|nr:unnamed protein product [Effrenium voratum]